MRWEKKELSPREIRVLAKRFDLDLLTSAILLRRGIVDEEDVFFFVETDLRYLHSPFLFSQMEMAVDRIRAAVESKESILIFGDRDVDGITSVVLLVESLRERGARMEWALPEGDDAYGLSCDTVRSAADDGVSLLITVDCGISSTDEIRLARERGIDTIILDHHHPQAELPEAAAIINPKAESDGYPFTELAACGVVFKLCWALVFSDSPVYKREFCLINVRPANDAYDVDAVRMVNLVAKERIHETLVPGLVPFEKTRLSGLVAGGEVVVFNEELQREQLSAALGGSFDLPLTDLRPEFEAAFPDRAASSLLKVREKNRRLRTPARFRDEIGVLEEVFSSVMVKKHGLIPETLERRTDLAALATLADIMPLRNENRILVRSGLSMINDRQRQALQEIMLRTGRYGRKVGSKELTWYVSPVLNSAGRMGRPHKAAELLLADNHEEIIGLAEEILAMNSGRKEMQDRIWDEVLQRARESKAACGEKFVFVSGDFISRGITGLLATRLSHLFGVPAVVVALLEERAVGSVRSPQAWSIRGFLELFEDLLSDFGGHDFAAGFSLPLSEMREFEQRFLSVVRDIEPEGVEDAPRQVDAELPPAYLTPDIRRTVAFFEPYGEGNPPLVFLTRGLKVLSKELFGRKGPVHLKLLLDSGRYKWPAIRWNGAGHEDSDVQIGDTVDMLYQVTHYGPSSRQSLQLIILEMTR